MMCPWRISSIVVQVTREDELYPFVETKRVPAAIPMEYSPFA